jgi:hypothetical protein
VIALALPVLDLVIDLLELLRPSNDPDFLAQLAHGRLRARLVAAHVTPG